MSPDKTGFEITHKFNNIFYFLILYFQYFLFSDSVFQEWRFVFESKHSESYQKVIIRCSVIIKTHTDIHTDRQTGSQSVRIAESNGTARSEYSGNQ